MNDQADEVSSDDKSASVAGTLATGGGNATAAGVTFQGAIGALFAAIAIADRPLDARFGIGAVRIKELRFETEAPLDDILIATEADGYVFTQAKTSLTLAKKLDSELGKMAEQIVRQWIACSGGDGTLGWNRPLVAGRDLFLIAVGLGGAGTVAKDLAQGLSLVADARQPMRQLQPMRRRLWNPSLPCSSWPGRMSSVVQQRLRTLHLCM